MMGLFNFLKPLISINKFEERISNQKYGSKKWKEIIQFFDNKLEVPRQVEFFFYGKDKEKALNLENDLKKLGYDVYGISRDKGKTYSVIGATTPISLEEKEFEKWVEKMNELGFVNDFHFDGWGMISELE